MSLINIGAGSRISLLARSKAVRTRKISIRKFGIETPFPMFRQNQWTKFSHAYYRSITNHPRWEILVLSAPSPRSEPLVYCSLVASTFPLLTWILANLKQPSIPADPISLSRCYNEKASTHLLPRLKPNHRTSMDMMAV